MSKEALKREWRERRVAEGRAREAAVQAAISREAAEERHDAELLFIRPGGAYLSRGLVRRFLQGAGLSLRMEVDGAPITPGFEILDGFQVMEFCDFEDWCDRSDFEQVIGKFETFKVLEFGDLPQQLRFFLGVQPTPDNFRWSEPLTTLPRHFQHAIENPAKGPSENIPFGRGVGSWWAHGASSLQEALPFELGFCWSPASVVYIRSLKADPTVVPDLARRERVNLARDMIGMADRLACQPGEHVELLERLRACASELATAAAGDTATVGPDAGKEPSLPPSTVPPAPAGETPTAIPSAIAQGPEPVSPAPAPLPGSLAKPQLLH